MSKKKPIAWYRYTMRLDRVECPMCSNTMYSVEIEMWMCETCDHITHDDELEWRVLKKEREQ